MSDLTEQPAAPSLATSAGVTPLQLLGDSGAACVGEFCDVPVRHDRAAVIQLLDSGTI